MNNKSLSRDRLAVCSWSLRPASFDELVEKLKPTGIQRVQIAFDPITRDPSNWSNLIERSRAAGLTLVSGMFGCPGEDYTTMESIHRTGGLLPDETWDDNLERAQINANLAKQLGLSLVTFHAGFLPADSSDPSHEKMLHRMRLVADIFAAHHIDLALETGQESADTLDRFLTALGRLNVGVNFDPANMILYDKGNPIDALKTLGQWLKQTHIKDGIQTKQAGVWGTEMPVGEGQVDWVEFFRTLDAVGFKGDCCIERESRGQRLVDIQSAVRVLENLHW